MLDCFVLDYYLHLIRLEDEKPTDSSSVRLRRDAHRARHAVLIYQVCLRQHPTLRRIGSLLAGFGGLRSTLGEQFVRKRALVFVFFQRHEI